MRALSAGKRVSRNQLLAIQARDNLPVGLYLTLLHQAIITGKFPIFDEHGNPTGISQELRVDQRMDLLKDLLNRALPALPKEISVTTDTDPNAESAVEARTLASLSDEELKQVVDASFEVLRADPNAAPRQ